MNEIEKKFKNALYELLDDGYIIQHIRKHYSVIGKSEKTKDDENYVDCEKYVRIPYKTYYKKEHKLSDRIELFISEQAKMGGYTLDFCLFSDVPSISVGIEIDGHDWHEKTKDQASADKKRERKLLSMGIPCIRFTGSDVFTNADGCAKEALDIYFSYYFETLLLTPSAYDTYIRGDE